MARHRRSRWATEAALQTLVRYGPQDSALRQAARDARSTYTSTVRTQRGAAEGIIGEVKRVTPGVRKGYDEAGLAAARTAHQVIDPVLKGLGSSAAPMVAATKIEQAGLQQRLKESRAADLGDLASRRVQAREGAAFATTNARNDLTAGLAKIFQRQQDLAGEKGAFAAATVGELQKAAADRALRLTINRRTLAQQDRNSRRSAAQTERDSLRSSGINPDTGKPIPGGKLDPRVANSRKWASQSEQQSARRTVAAALDYAHTFALTGTSRAEAHKLLVQGHPDTPERRVPLHDPKTGKPVFNPDGTPATKVVQAMPGVKKVDDPLMARVAIEMAYDGHISRATARALHRNNYRVGPLGVVTYEQWRRRHPPYRGGGGHGGAPGANGQLRPT